MLSSLAVLPGCGEPPAKEPSPKVDLPLHVLSKPKKSYGTNATTSPSRESPPAALASKDSEIPRPKRTTLPSGLQVAVIESHSLPIAQIRVMIRAGNGYGAPAVARVTGDLLKDGGTRTMSSAELVRRVETLGADLGIDVRMDSTVISLAVPKDKLNEALSILGEVVSAPRFDQGELKKLKDRLVDESESRARQSGGFQATRLAFATLFPQGPYSRYDALASEVKKVTAEDVTDFHHKFFVTKNMEVVIAGDVDATQASEAAKKAFSGVRADSAPAVSFPAPKAVDKRRVIIADRPKSVQSDVFIVSIAPERKSPMYPAMRVANQVLGGGMQGRLFQDVRESRSLAYSTGSQLIELSEGPELTLATAGTQSPKTSDAVRGVLENLDKMRNGVTAAENAGARRYLADIYAVRLETLGALADLYVTKDVLRLEDDYFDKYRAALRDMSTEKTSAAAKELFDASHVVVIVSGDASQIGEGLRKFGEVTITDPEHDFAVTKTLPASE